MPGGYVRITVTHSVEAPTLAHIHVGAEGETGVLVSELANPTSPYVLDLSPEDFETLTASDYYFDVHSEAYPDGEIRGQINCGGEEHNVLCEFGLEASQEVSETPVESTATGSAVFTLLESGNVLVTVEHNVSNPTAAHIHAAEAGVNGSVEIAFESAVSPIMKELTPEEYALVTATPHYINVHSEDYPGGEIQQGQLSCVDSKAFCEWPLSSGAIVSETPVESSAEGFAAFSELPGGYVRLTVLHTSSGCERSQYSRGRYG